MPITLYRPYCTLTDVQTVTGANDEGLDDTLNEAINHASRLVDEMTGRDFWFHEFAGDDTFVVSRNAVIGGIALLPFEVITLTAVGVDGSGLDVDALHYRAGEMFIESSSPFGGFPFTSKLEVQGTFGYPLKIVEDVPVLTEPPPTIPMSIRRATALIAGALSGEWKKERVSPDGFRESILENRIPSEARALLKQYDIRKRLAVF